MQRCDLGAITGGSQTHHKRALREGASALAGARLKIFELNGEAVFYAQRARLCAATLRGIFITPKARDISGRLFLPVFL